MDAHLDDGQEALAPELDFRGGLIAAALGGLGTEPLGPEAWEGQGLEPDAPEAIALPDDAPLGPEAPAFEEAPEAVAPMRAQPWQAEPSALPPAPGASPLDSEAPVVAPPPGGGGASAASEAGAWWQGEAAPEWAPEGLSAEALNPPAAELDEVALTLAPLFHQGHVPRRSAPRLMDPQVRQDAERRLNAVGLSLAWSPYSRHVGLSLAEGTSGGRERITNLKELDRNALALLVILWARLVLPQRLAAEGREGGLGDPVVSFEALNAEFGKKLGGRRFEMYLAQLKRLGFLEYTRKDELRAGPFLDLLGDAQALASYLRQSALAYLLRGVDGGEAEASAAEGEEALEAEEAPQEAVAERATRSGWHRLGAPVQGGVGA